MIASLNPFNGQLLQAYSEHTPEETEYRLALSTKIFREWRKRAFSERAELLLRAADLLESGKRPLAELMTREMGKTIASAEAEVLKCASGCRYYAQTTEAALRDTPVPTEASHSYIHYQPLGPILAIMPWNFPFWQVFRFAAPALMAGNTCLLKHASNVPGCALAIEAIFREAGFPEGAFQTLLLEVNKVPSLIDDPRVAAVTLTGSENAGSAVASQAGRQIKKTVLELGGSDPFIVMPSANIQEAMRTAVLARTINNGQSCIAAKRFFVADSIYDQFEIGFVLALQSLVLGDPMDPATQIGPLATEKIASALEHQVMRAVADGAQLLTGGKRVPGHCCLFQPTVLKELPGASAVYQEEFFGPVALLFRVHNHAQAVEMANDSPFGLGASVWTEDLAEQAFFIEELEAGQVFVNGMVASDPRLPFGGIKRSGYGRELGEAGIREFVNMKTVWVK